MAEPAPQRRVVAAWLRQADHDLRTHTCPAVVGLHHDVWINARADVVVKLHEQKVEELGHLPQRVAG